MNLAVSGLLGWGVILAIWLGLMPSATRGKSWHYVHAVIPIIAAGTFLLLDEGVLRDVLRVWLLAGVFLLFDLILCWAIGTALRNHGIMDIAYPLLLLSAAGAMAYLFRPNFSGWSFALLGIIAVWALRRSVQTFRQNIAREREPYASWRRRHEGVWVRWSFFQIHLLQGVLIWIWSLSFAFAFAAPVPQSLWPAGLGFLVWAVGFLLQAVADFQLKKFKDDPANQGGLLVSGAWSVMRHPNYFGEALIWWGFFVFALAHPLGVLAIVSPAYVTWFMGYGSAARFKEMHMSRTRPQTWAAYVATTPRFFPWPRPAGK